MLQKFFKFRIDNSNVVNRRKYERLVIDLKTSLRIDVVLKSIPRLIKKYFIANFKKYMEFRGNKITRTQSPFKMENFLNYVHDL